MVSSNERSRAGSAYPPAASTEKDYVTIVSLRCSVDKLSGFSLAGKPDDDSPFNRLPMESPVISFVIQPLPLTPFVVKTLKVTTLKSIL